MVLSAAPEEFVLSDDYEGREQSLFKHYVLKEYLCILAMKTGMSGVQHLNYIDCFAGPWKSETRNFSDTSPKIAINELLNARNALLQNGKNAEMRFLFIEKDQAAYGNLQQVLSPFGDYDIESYNTEFVKTIPQIQAFINRRPTCHPTELLIRLK